jgi:hypothetical protein
MRVLIAAVLLALLAAQPQTAQVQFAFETDEHQDFVAAFVQKGNGTQVPCLQVTQVAGETRCSASLTVPDTVRLQLLRPACGPAVPLGGCRSELSNPVAINGGGPTGQPPGPFTVTFSGALPPPPVGVARMARQFTSGSGYSYADNAVFDLPTTGTLSLWVKLPDLTTSRFIITKFGNYQISQSNGDVHVLYNTSATHPVLTIGPNQTWGWAVPIPSAGVWYNLILTWSADDPVAAYLDNVVVSGGASFFGGSTRDLTQPLQVGSNAGNAWINGEISHLAMYNTVVSSGDRASLQTTIPSAVGTPQAYIDFDTSINEQLASIAPTVTGTVNTTTGPTLSGGGGGGGAPFNLRGGLLGLY